VWRTVRTDDYLARNGRGCTVTLSTHGDKHLKNDVHTLIHVTPIHNDEIRMRDINYVSVHAEMKYGYTLLKVTLSDREALQTESIDVEMKNMIIKREKENKNRTA